MDSTTEPIAPDPAESSEALLASLDFTAMAHSMIGARHPSLRSLGTSMEAGHALGELAQQTRSTAWNVQRRMTFYSMRNGRRLDEEARARGVTFRTVVGPASLELCPLLSSYERGVRVFHVPAPLLILDARTAIFPGREPESTWLSSDPDLVSLAVRAFEAMWAEARPAVPEGEEPPLTPRMVDIAWLLADGASDRQISRELGVSERTVSAEVRQIGRRLGSTNRAHTIARICGAPGQRPDPT